MPGGRPSKFREEFTDQVYRLALLGLSDIEIAQFFEVPEQTLYRWDKAHPEFREARARGKIPADGKVARAVFKRALGYSHEAVKIMQYEGNPIEVPYIEHYPPDTQAATWWLKNRQPDKWRDRQELTGAGGGPLVIATGVVRNEDPA